MPELNFVEKTREQLTYRLEQPGSLHDGARVVVVSGGQEPRSQGSLVDKFRMAVAFTNGQAHVKSDFRCEFDKKQHQAPKDALPLLTDTPVLSCPSELRVLKMGLAADCNYVYRKGGTDAALRSILHTWDEVSDLYRENFNVVIAIVDIRLYTRCHAEKATVALGGTAAKKTDAPPSWNRECASEYTMMERLSDFSLWRSHMGSEAGLWHLMTGCPSAPTAGLSWGGVVCTQGLSQNRDGLWMSGAGVSSLDGRNEVQVIAHELAHGFGASHDCEDGCTCTGSDCAECCPCIGQPPFDFERVFIGGALRNAHPLADDRSLSLTVFPGCSCKRHFLMSSTTNMLSMQVSQCTKREICAGIGLSGHCLVRYEAKVQGKVTMGQCGNGILEPGEECDCGTPADCALDPCCGSDCRLKPRALCSDKNHACCKGCQVVPATAHLECRPSTGPCDKSELCDGRSADCPADTFQPDGLVCPGGSANTTCASGVCTSKTLQCQDLARRFGSTGSCSAYGVDFDERECRMQCVTESHGCIPMSEHYINGTECSAGRCYDGKCVSMPFHQVQLFLSRLYSPPYLYMTGPLTLVVLAIVFVVIRVCVQAIRRQKKNA